MRCQPPPSSSNLRPTAAKLLTLSVEIQPQSTPPSQRALIRNVARTVLRLQQVEERCKLSVHLVDEDEIARINADHRGVSAPTDVLSFPQVEDSGFVTPPGEPKHLGDIVLSLTRVAEQAVEYGHSFERELGYLTAHGLLHILGYDHEDPTDQAVMRGHEEAAMESAGLTR